MSAAPVMGLAGWVLGASHQPDQCSVVCPRATARALLRKWHVTRRVAIFGSVGDALQARRFGDEGYGAGWHPTTSADRNPALRLADWVTHGSWPETGDTGDTGERPGR